MPLLATSLSRYNKVNKARGHPEPHSMWGGVPLKKLGFLVCNNLKGGKRDEAFFQQKNL